MLNNLSVTGKFTIRDARPSDGEFIARNVLAAMGYEVFNVDADSAIEFGSTSLNVQGAVKLVGEICARPDTLYSYARTRIACVEGNAVGSLTAYSGDDYLSLRELTWGLLNSMFEGAAPSEDEDPTRSAACFPSVEVSMVRVIMKARGRTSLLRSRSVCPASSISTVWLYSPSSAGWPLNMPARPTA